MLSPPVSSLSVARNHRHLRSATRSWGLPALKSSDRCQVTKDNYRVAVCLRVVTACISLRIPLCLDNPLGSYLWKFSGLQKIDQQVRCFRHSPLCFWITLEKATRLVFGGQSDRACFHSPYSHRFRCHGKHGFCGFREGHKHLVLQGTLTQQSTKYPPQCSCWIQHSSEIGLAPPL